jgi:hypothetical protein
MIVNVTCRHPGDELRRLVDFAASLSAADLTTVCVNVKNCSDAMAGRAYKKVPSLSNAPAHASALVILRVGPASCYPHSNLVKKWRQVHAKRDGRSVSWFERDRRAEHSYGGKSSPYIDYRDWKEGLVGLAAHEFEHIHQFQNQLPCSEVACERAALRTLEAYRELLPKGTRDHESFA